MIDPLYVASGFGVGLLVGMTGVGGGSLMTPLLILLFGVHPSTAVGTDLLYAAATKTGGSLIHGLGRSIHWPAVIRLACGSLPASVVTLLVMWQLDLDSSSQKSLVNLVLCFALLLTATSLIFRRAIMKRYRLRDRADGSSPRYPGFDFLGWSRRRRRDRATAALSAPADGADRWFRHRACSAADAGGGSRALGAGRGRLAFDGRVADGLPARHRNRQLQRATRAGDGAARHARRRPAHGSGQDRRAGTAVAVGSRHRASERLSLDGPIARP